MSDPDIAGDNFLRENLRPDRHPCLCDNPQCGACVCISDGKAVNSCTTAVNG